MIIIGKPYIAEEGDYSYLKASVKVSEDAAKAWIDFSNKNYKIFWRTNRDYPPKVWQEKDHTLWFKVPKEYGKYLADEICDAFLVAMIYYAMATGSDIECKAPVSERLYYGITTHLIPLLCDKKYGYRKIKLTTKTTNKNYSTQHINGTGMSCGVDSMYTLMKYTADDMPESFKLGALTYLNMGAVFHPSINSIKDYTLDEFYRKTDEISLQKLENAYAVGKLAGLPVIYVESNIDKDYYRGCYGYTGVYRNMACVLALSKYFSKYYCSSAGWPRFYDPTLHDGSEHYELMMCPALSTDSVEFILSDQFTRIEKTTALANFEIAQKYLDVCFNFDNCGKCQKCYRTLITLDVFGALDKYSECFDIEAYKKNRDKAYYWLLKTHDPKSTVDNAVFANEIYGIAKQKGVIPIKSRVKYFFLCIPLKIERFIMNHLMSDAMVKKCLKLFKKI
ncbi:MAG: hypothetical protein K6F76_01315 [Clostridiales bacterium]|nr:hypothetical protein [Clostridiales bacterium]